MDMTTLGAAIAIAKGMPGTAAESAARAEAAAALAESVAAEALDATWQQGTISSGNLVDMPTRAVSSLIENIAEGDVISGKNGIQVRPIFYKDGEFKQAYGTAGDTFTITATHVQNYDAIRIVASRTDNKEYITPAQAENAVSYTGTQTGTATAAAKQDYDALETRVSATETVNVAITSAAPTITAAANRRYLCGTLTSLSFTPCVDGLCEVIFTSGSTPTTLTLPDTVKMPDWWTGVAANRTYDIMILNGTYGVVTSWAT